MRRQLLRSDRRPAGRLLSTGGPPVMIGRCDIPSLPLSSTSADFSKDRQKQPPDFCAGRLGSCRGEGVAGGPKGLLLTRLRGLHAHARCRGHGTRGDGGCCGRRHAHAKPGQHLRASHRPPDATDTVAGAMPTARCGHGDETAYRELRSSGGEPKQQVPRLLELLPLCRRQRLAHDGGCCKSRKALDFLGRLLPQRRPEKSRSRTQN